MKKISKEDICYFFQGLMKREMKCPYCKGKPVVYAKKYIVISICKCNNCGLFFVNPFYLPRQGIKKFYDDSYSSDATIMPSTKTIESLKSTNFNGHPKDYSHILNVIRRLVKGNRLLEYGSSWGYFLYQAKSYGFEPIGIEISQKRAGFGIRNLGVDIFEDIKLIKEKFDLICSFHCLEHLIDLSEIFDKFHDRLLPGGSLIIEVPNFDPETKGKSVYSIIGKVHPLGFCKYFFERNLPRHDFSQVNIAGKYEDLLKKPEERLFLRNVVIVHAKKIK